MIRPLTCLTLIAAAGAGLYLYQEKHRAQMVDREINRVVHATEQTRDRTGMMRAEWALLSEPDRLAGLAAQHLALQTMSPGQFAQLADLGNRLPAVGAPTQPPAAMEPPAPVASAADPAAAKADPARPPLPLAAQMGAGTTLPPRPNTPMMAQAAPPRPARPVKLASVKPRDPEPSYHPVYAPVMQAFASQQPPQPIHPPSVQQAAATPYTPPYVGSALGMARTMLAAPAPIAYGAERPSIQ